MNYKISNHSSICFLATVIFSTIHVSNSAAQDSSYIPPPVTNKVKIYRDQVVKDSRKQMIELKTVIPNLVYDLRYASTNNFMNRLMYPAHTNQTFLRAPAAMALQKVQYELNEMGLGLKIFDAYRPYSVTQKFWELVKDERYVAHPAKGSGHNKGIAVDLTIINKSTGEELEMGTGFDNFTDTAHSAFTQLHEQVLKNRELLKSVMEKNGFRVLSTEWWHFYLLDNPGYEILDLDFRKLARSPFKR